MTSHSVYYQPKSAAYILLHLDRQLKTHLFLKKNIQLTEILDRLIFNSSHCLLTFHSEQSKNIASPHDDDNSALNDMAPKFNPSLKNTTTKTPSNLDFCQNKGVHLRFFLYFPFITQ